MVSESSEGQTVSVALPTELIEWLESEANETGVERDTLLAQLLASYRAMEEIEGELENGAVALDITDVTETALAGQLDGKLETKVDEQVNQAKDALQRQLDSQIETLEAEFQEKLQDVRHRVVQVKKESDSKAPEGHAHPEFDELTALVEQVETLQSEFDQFKATYEETVSAQEDAVDTHDARLEELQDRLQTVAWVVSDLRNAQDSSTEIETVERIKRAAARADIERATCENCGNGVTLSLLTEPRCPHCEATVTNVEPATGWFGTSVLTVASQLESGEKR